MEDKALLSTEEASGAEKAELLIVIPAYNEAENIERVVNHLTANFPQYDYVVVNDGSRDETAGLKYADKYGYQYAVQLDGDGQHRPEYLESMIKKMEEGYDIVIGSRFVGEKKPFTMRMLQNGCQYQGSDLGNADVQQAHDPRICIGA